MKVNVWLPSLTREAGQKQVNVGHASATLDDGTYISWWPAGDGAAPKRPLSVGFDTPSFQDDIRSEGNRDPLVVNLSGLSEGVIRTWWSRVRTEGLAPSPLQPVFHPKRQQYELYDTNCSTIVALALALDLGGAISVLGFRWQPTGGVWTPPEIYAWTTALKTASLVKRIAGGR